MRQAVERVSSSGLAIVRVAAELGVHETLLRRWMKQFAAPGTGLAQRSVTQAQALSPADLAAGVDTMMVLSASGSGPVLYSRGRDVEDSELAVEFADERCEWESHGDADLARNPGLNTDIITALEKASDAMTPKQLAAVVEADEASVRQAVRRLAKRGEIRKAGYGRYESNF